jgi:alcohol dehydrogenase class IV
MFYSVLAKRLGWANWDDDAKKAAFSVVKKIKELQKSIDFVSNLKGLGISKEDFDNNLDMLVSLFFQDPSGVMAPRIPNKDEITKLYQYAYNGKDVDF